MKNPILLYHRYLPVSVVVVPGQRHTANGILKGPNGSLLIDMCTKCKHVAHMSKMIQIRHVPEALHRALRARAARAGMTLSDYLRAELARAVEQLTPDELRERLATLEPAAVREPPARAVRRERDRA